MSKYYDKIKLKVVKYVVDENYSTYEATRKFKVSNSSIKKWVRKYQ